MPCCRTAIPWLLTGLLIGCNVQAQDKPSPAKAVAELHDAGSRIACGAIKPAG